MKDFSAKEPSLPFGENAKINQESIMPSVMARLFSSCLNSDVTFKVEGQEFKAHRAILAIQSPVFEKMLLGNAFKESINDGAGVIVLPNKHASSFEIFLKYLYTFTVDLASLDLETAIEILLMAHEYHVPQLFAGFQNVLEFGIVNEESVFKIFECGLFLDDEQLLSACREYLYDNAEQVVKNPKFSELSKTAVIDLISSDLFFTPEIDILSAVSAWCKKNSDEDPKDVLKMVRFPFVQLDGLTMTSVAPLYKLLISHGIDPECFDEQFLAQSKTCVPRKPVGHIPTGNVVSLTQGALVEGPDAAGVESVFNGKSGWGGFMPFGSPITIKFAKVYQISTMSFFIYSGCESARFCSYKVEISRNKATWECLADCQQIQCSIQQVFMFSPRYIQYVRVTAFRMPDYHGPNTYAVEQLQCPAVDIQPEDRARYTQHCPNGPQKFTVSCEQPP